MITYLKFKEISLILIKIFKLTKAEFFHNANINETTIMILITIYNLEVSASS